MKEFSILMRLWFVAGGLYAAWWAYRLVANHFLACQQPGVTIPGRWVTGICGSYGSQWAAVAMASSAALLLALALWPKRRGSAA